HQLDRVQGVGPEVLDELRRRGDLALLDPELLADDLLHPLLNGLRRHDRAPSSSIGPAGSCALRPPAPPPCLASLARLQTVPPIAPRDRERVPATPEIFNALTCTTHRSRE